MSNGHQQHHTPMSGSRVTNGAETGGKNADLALDYIASLFAVNGNLNAFPMQPFQQQQSITPNMEELMSSIMAAAVNANNQSASTSASSTSSTFENFAAANFLSSMMYSQQQQKQLQQMQRAEQQQQQQQQQNPMNQLPLYFPRPPMTFDRPDYGLTSQQTQDQRQHHQMAVAMAALLSRYGRDFLHTLHHQQETSSSNRETEESFSAVLEKLTQDLNQNAANTPNSANPTTTTTTTNNNNLVRNRNPSHSQTPDRVSTTPSCTSKFVQSAVGENSTTLAAAAAAAAAALNILQNQEAFGKNRSSTKSTGSEQARNQLTSQHRTQTQTRSSPGQPQCHRGRGRPPKTSLPGAKVPTEKVVLASQSEGTKYADASSIDGTITDVLKRLNNSSEQFGLRKRRRVDAGEKLTPGTSSSTPGPSAKPETAGLKRARTYADGGYLLPLGLGWRRETLVKGVGPSGILGDVVYLTPSGEQMWSIECIREYLRATGNTMLTTEDFTFKSYIRLGDYFECTKDANGFIKMTEEAVNSLHPTSKKSHTHEGHLESHQRASSPSTRSASSNANSKSSASAANGPFTAELMAAMLSTSADTYAKQFSEFAMGLPRIPSLPPQVTSLVASQIGALWNPWSQTVSASTSGTSYPYGSTQHHRQQLQPQHSTATSQIPNPNSLEEFERLRAFFSKLVEDHQRLENQKESQRKADLEARTAKAREERIAYLVEEELCRPVEDLLLINPEPLPPFDPIDGNRMPSEVFTDCVYVLEFLHAFTEVLCIDPETIPTMRCLQAAFVDRDETCIEVVNHLIIELLKFAILDPGIPTPRLVTQILNQRFSEMEVNTQTVTGLLRVFLIGRNGYEDAMSDWLAPSNVSHLTELPGPQLASLLVFICDELACSSRIISNEVDRTVEFQISLRRDKFALEAKIRKIRVILARKFGLDHTVKANGDSDIANRELPAFLYKTHRFAGSQNYDSDDEEELSSAEELEKRIEQLNQCLEAKERAIRACTFRLSGVFLGQDRYHRNYFVLGSVGGIYVEGQPTKNPEGSVAMETPEVFDADAIVAEIKARRELASKRHFAVNSSNSSGTCSSNQKSNPPRSTARMDKPNTEIEKEEEEEDEERSEVKPEIKECKEVTENDGKREGIGKNGEKIDEIDEKEVSSGQEEVVDETEKIPEKKEEEENVVKDTEKAEVTEGSSVSQPLDLSTKRVASPPPSPVIKSPPAKPTALTQESDLKIWKSLTEQDLAEAVEACQLDDTFLTTATILFATHTDAIDRNSLANGWTDPNWHAHLLIYKVLLIQAIAFEMRKHCDSDEKALSKALRQLKAWLVESGLESGDDRGLMTGSRELSAIQFDEEEVATEVEEILKDRGIQMMDSEAKKSIPAEYKSNWWRVKGSGVQKLLKGLLTRGIRERSLGQAIQLAEDTVTASINADASDILDFPLSSSSSSAEPVEDNWKPHLLRVRSRRGKGRGTHPSTSYLSSSSSSQTLSGLTRNSNTPSQHHNTASTFDAASTAGDSADVYSFGGMTIGVSGGALDAREGSPTRTSSVIEQSVFLGENFERAMRRDRSTGDGESLTPEERQFLDECRFLELVEGLVDRVLSASLQTKGWQAPMKATEDDSIQIVPRNTPKVYRYDFWPLELARERLLDLETHTERRYLLPPLNCESRLDAVQAQVAAKEAAGTTEDSTTPTVSINDGGTGSVCSDSNTTNEETRKTSENGNSSGGSGQVTEGESQGLVMWRRSTRKADSVAELKRCAMQFEAAIAWDKSIMKVLCQICRRDKNEARLLLCDGCDHGYHTYCFRPPMVSIPEGDWFCYDCVSKATGKCHCFVCGLTTPLGVDSIPSGATTVSVEPAHRLVQCVSCSRGAHPACLRPATSRLPKKWTCVVCMNGEASTADRRLAPTVSNSESSKKAQNQTHHSDRSKRVHIKASHLRNLKHLSSPMSTASKSKSESSSRVGRPKSSSTGKRKSTSSDAAVAAPQRKRGRPPSLHKKGRTSAGEEEVVGMCKETERPKVVNGNDDAENGNEEQEARLGGSGDDASSIDEEAEGEAVGDESESRVSSGAVSNVNGSASETKKKLGRARKTPLGPEDRDFCRRATEDLMNHELSWPFQKPVCCKTVPIYRKVIKHPMDLSTVLKRLNADKCRYTSVGQWREDIRLIFKNCKIFNEDESEIGKAGHELRRYFETTWAKSSRHHKSRTEASSPETKVDSIHTAPSSPEGQEPEKSAASPVEKSTEGEAVEEVPGSPLSKPGTPIKAAEGVEASQATINPSVV